MSKINSPCIKNCCLDKKDVCIGCGRTFEEIVRWSDAGDQEKQQILASAKVRIKNRAENGFDI